MATNESLKDVIARQNAAPQDNFVKNCALTLFAEHRGSNESIGFFGGDAYPAAWVSTDKKGRRYGLALAADGLGSGNFVHPSLQQWVATKGTTEEEKLHAYLEQMYGKAFFDDTEAVEYAVRNFLPVPPNCFFNDENGVGQYNKPFYEKDSQYLSSRTVSIGVFYRFRRYFDDKEFTPDNVAKLREAIEVYLDRDLRANLFKVFDYSDTTNADKRNKYFLPCTMACWFFQEQEKDVLAAAYYVGDARCYKVDLTDGVMLISQDDANPLDNNMNCCIRFGEYNEANPQGMKDCAIKATFVQLDKPCAVFACSDGVYDTCSALDASNKICLPAGRNEFVKYEVTKLHESNDIAFERNYLEILRRANSLDDVSQLTATHIYCHSRLDTAGGTYSAVADCGNPGDIKRDDSATMGMVFFGLTEAGYPLLLDELKDDAKWQNLSLIRLYDELEREADKNTYSIVCPPVDSEDNPDVIEAGIRMQYVGAMLGVTLPWIEEDSNKAVADRKNTMWGGIEVAGPVTGLARKRFFNTNALFIFNKMCDDAKAIYNFVPRPKESVEAVSSAYEALCAAYEDVAALNEKKIEIDKFSQAYGNVDKQMRKDGKELEAMIKTYEELQKQWDEFVRQINSKLPDLQTQLNIVKSLDVNNGARGFGRYNVVNDANLVGIATNVDLTYGEEQAYKMLMDISRQSQETGRQLDAIRAWLGNAAQGIRHVDEIAVQNVTNEANRTKALNAMSNVACGKFNDSYDAIEAVLARDKKNVFKNPALANFEGIASKWDANKQGAKDYANGKGKQRIPLPPTIIEKVPVDLQNPSHVLNNYDRYIAANQMIATMVGDEQYGMYNIREKIKSDIDEQLKETGNLYGVAIKANEAYERIAYATRAEEPLVKGTTYRSVYQTGHRGIIDVKK